MLGMQELIIILLIVVLLFGGKRIPEIMSGLGKGIKSFKKAVDGQDESPEEHASAPNRPTNASHSETAQSGSDLSKTS